MRLYIAEKPSVGNAIAEFLAESLGGKMQKIRGDRGVTHIIVGNDVVTWCFGHILQQVDPEGYDPRFKSWSQSQSLLPVIPSEWKLEPTKGGKERLDIIRDLLQSATEVVHAGDPDPEGQLLVDEVLIYLKNKSPVKRVLPTAVDRVSIQRVLAAIADNTDQKFVGMYERALGRSRADWLMGMNLTRACTLANQNSGGTGVLSIGRVQTPALAMVVKRDLEIDNFKPVTFFDMQASFKHAKGGYLGKWKPSEGQKGLDSEGRLTDKAVATAIATAVQGKPGKIAEYSVADRSQKPPLPFSLSTLTAKASARFGMSAAKVLEIAQSLYETHKVASYPRTDCQYVPESQHAYAPDILKAIAKFDPSIAALTAGANTKLKSAAYNDKPIVSHHGIVPTENASYGSLTSDERKVFGLIVQSYIAQFYPDYTFKQTNVMTECAGHQFTATGRTPVDLGWRKVFGASEDDEPEAGKKGEVEQNLPPMTKGDGVTCDKMAAKESKTKPPPRYTEGTLNTAMTNVHDLVDDPELRKRLKEAKGIGTDATRPDMFEKIKKRKFAENKAGKFISTQAGKDLIAALPKEVTDVVTTALWEDAGRKVESGVVKFEDFVNKQISWVTKLTHQSLASTINIGVGIKNTAVLEAAKAMSGSCPSCNKGTMRMMTARKGPNAGNQFMGCSNYPDCKHTINIEGQEKNGASKSAAPAKSYAKKPAYASKPARAPRR